MNKDIEGKIENLRLNKEIEEKLKENEIIYIQQLTNLRKTDLKNIGLTSHQITETEAKLQLGGYDLRTNTYKKQTSKKTRVKN